VSDWRKAFHEEGRAYIAAFVAQIPECSIHPGQMEQGWSHYVERGTYQGHDVVLKFFNMDERWQNELFCMEHLAPTGLVPKVRATHGRRLIVMDYVPGTMPRKYGIDDAVLSDPKRRELLSHDLGQATGKITMVPLPTDADGKFPPAGFVPFEPTGWSDSVVAGINFYIDLARRIKREVPAYEVAVFNEALRLLEHARNCTESEPKIMFRYDFGNLNVHDGRLQGIFDLESTRLGTPSMQLSKGLACCTDYGLDREAFLTGYEEITGTRPRDEDYLVLLAMNQLERLLRVCKGGNWDGSEADIKQADEIARNSLDDLRRSVNSYRPWIDVARWFPSMVDS